MGGQVDLMFDNLTAAIGHHPQRKAARAGGDHEHALPRAARPAHDAGSRIPGYEVTAWFGIMLPKGAPKDIVLRINGEVNKALVQADMKERLCSRARSQPRGPEQFGSFIHDEVVKWAKVVKASGAKVE